MLALSSGPAGAVDLDPVALVLHASGPVFLVVWSLAAAGALVWMIAALKLLQIARLSAAERRFELASQDAAIPSELFEIARLHPEAPGARVVRAIERRGGGRGLAEAAAKRAIVAEQQRAGSLMTTLSSIAAAAPFVGLFGTVYGIMDAFLRIGRERSAQLPVVAPAIGEALIATAIGLLAAIPAVVVYNAVNKRADDLLSELEAAADAWVEIAAGGPPPSAHRAAEAAPG